MSSEERGDALTRLGTQWGTPTFRLDPERGRVWSCLDPLPQVLIVDSRWQAEGFVSKGESRTDESLTIRTFDLPLLLITSPPTAHCMGACSAKGS